MRIHALIGSAVAALALGLAACGDDERRPPAQQRPVQLTITAPADSALVTGEAVEVRGRVAPSGASVRVLGRPALVSAGTFTIVVPLDPGANVVDVIASAGGRAPALTAIRVTREDRVEVPDLVGTPLSELETELEPLGLKAESERGGGLLDPLIPREQRVCEQDPEPGAKVRRGATVHVVVARDC
ncbi:MAG TPA: PASTA domain-containing protein [Solirubrobacteraceae bacterium]|nr:PASTA domain-containing protein [Solirubrobacteraceae bacterium]